MVSPMIQADRAFAKYIRERDGTCQAASTPGCTGQMYLQCAHLISRSYKSIRTNPSNAVALCRSCHMYYTHRPIEWELWVLGRFGMDYYGRLREQALRYERVDWKFEADYWKAQI